MEEKNSNFRSCLRSLFSFRRSFKLIFSRTNNSGGAGFTLIELLVVISILGILTVGFLILINPQRQLQKARDSQRKAALKQIQSGLELYRSDQGSYPASVPNCGVSLLDKCLGTTATYIQTVPTDPKNGTSYYYSYNSSAGTYTLASCLGNTSDTGGTDTSPGGPSCNPAYYYVVNNP